MKRLYSKRTHASNADRRRRKAEASAAIINAPTLRVMRYVRAEGGDVLLDARHRTALRKLGMSRIAIDAALTVAVRRGLVLLSDVAGTIRVQLASSGEGK